MLSISDDDYLPDIPDSVHTATITAIKSRDSSNGNEMWVITLRLKECRQDLTVWQVVDGEFSPRAKKWVKDTLRDMHSCFNMPANSDNPDDWIGHSGYVRTKHTESDDGNTYINIDKYLPPEKGRRLIAAQMAKPPAPDLPPQRNDFKPSAADPLDLDIGF